MDGVVEDMGTWDADEETEEGIIVGVEVGVGMAVETGVKVILKGGMVAELDEPAEAKDL